MENELFPCPFCGTQPRISCPSTFHDGAWSVSNEYSYITCKNEECVMNKKDYSCDYNAAIAWNTRLIKNYREAYQHGYEKGHKDAYQLGYETGHEDAGVKLEHEGDYEEYMRLAKKHLSNKTWIPTLDDLRAREKEIKNEKNY